jgi:glycosyltransferase involved in cell wall biosynthesis
MPEAIARIIEVVPRAYPALGGVESHVRRISQALAQRGVEVSVYSHAVARKPRVGSLENHDGVMYRRFAVPFGGAIPLPSLRLMRELRKNARGVDVVHLHQYHQPLAFFASLALMGVKTPIVVTPHYHGTGHTPFARLLHKVWRPTAGRFLMSNASRVIAVSPPEAELIIQHFPFLDGRVDVIPNGIEPPPPAEPARVPAGKRVVLSVGRLESYKRFDALVQAVARLDDSILLALVGDGPQREALQRQARELGVEHRVLFLGRLDDTELASWWARADVFVSLSEQEAFGIALGEALAVGVPVIASDIPAFRYVADLAQAHGAPPDAIRFADEDGLRELLGDPVTRVTPVMVSRWDNAADMTLETAVLAHKKVTHDFARRVGSTRRTP